MHEFGLCEGVLETVERRAAGRPVDAFRVRVGALHRVSEEAFDQAFEMVSAGSVAEGADVELFVVPVSIRCRGCGHASETDDPFGACPACGGTDLEMEGGDELILEWIRIAPS
ncbi:MAG TPA: hydrogenase maturation nickel metallochaperone HypA, partial [Myxococcaceae bacterium]